VAAYFAVEKVARLQCEVLPSHACAVWSLDEGFVQARAKRRVRQDTEDRRAGVAKNESEEPTMLMVTAPTATNPNLSAQGGVFTLVQPRSGDPFPLPDLDALLPQLAPRVPKDWERSAPFLWKYTLPADQGRLALRLLAAKGIHAASVYPGLAGIMKMFEERRHHHVVAAPPSVNGPKK